MGLAAIESFRRMGDRCRQDSQLWLKRNSIAQEILALCGDTLSVIDRAASCWWACSGPNSPHAVEYLLGGSASATEAALDLALRGHYDESISMTRTVAERVNLLTLFVYSVSDFRAWIVADDRERFKKYSPFKVRVALEALGKDVPFSEEYYRALSGRGVHAGAVPQVYSPHGRPAAGAHFQAAGLEVCITEMAVALSYFASIGIGILSHIPIELRREAWDYPMRLAEKVAKSGSASLLTLEDFLAANPDVPTAVPRPPSTSTK
jgi:hypothetical protein